MDITDGALSYTFLFDTSQGEASMEKLIENLKAMGLSAEEAGRVADELASKMTDALKEVADGAVDAEDAVERIRAKSDELRDSAEEVADSLEGVKAEFLADSLDAVGDAIEEDTTLFDKLSDSAKSANGALDIGSIAMKALVEVTGKGTVAVKAFSVAQKALNAVLAKNPIGAIVIAIAGAIGIIKKIIDITKKDKEAQRDLNGELKQQVDLIQLLNSGYNTFNKTRQGQLNNELSLLREKNATLSEIRAKEDEIYQLEGERVNKNYEDNKREIENIETRKKELNDLGKTVQYFNDKYQWSHELAESTNLSKRDRKKYKEKEEEYKKQLDEYTKQYEELQTSVVKLEKIQQEKNDFESNQAIIEERRAKEDWDRNMKIIADQNAINEEQVSVLREGYSKRVKEIQAGKRAERDALEAELYAPDSGLTDIEKENLRKRIELNKQAEAKEIAEVYREQNEAIVRAKEGLYKLEYQELSKRTAKEMEILQAEIDMMEEGTSKEIAQMQLDHKRRLFEIEREADEEAEALREANKQRWLDEQTAKGKSVTDADWYSSDAFKSLIGGLTEEQRKQIADQRQKDTDNENAIAAKQNKDFLNNMLLDYANYTAQKKQIDEQYLQDLNVATLALMTATTEEEKKIYAELIGDIGKSKARNQLDLDKARIDATAYTTVAERMDDINKAYETYIESLRLAGASEAEINAAIAEQVEQTGTLTRLEAERADLEARIRNLQQGGTDKEGLSLADLLDRLAKVNKELDKATAKSFKELWNENKNTLVANSLDQVADAMFRLAEASGSLNAEQAAQFMSSLSKGLKGFQQGGFFGLLVAGIEDTIAQLSDALVAGEALETSLNQARVDKWKQEMADMLNSGDTIFGNDAIARINGMVAVLEESRRKMVEFNKEEQSLGEFDFNRALEATNALSWRNYAAMFGAETRNDVKAYFAAIEKGYSDVEAHVLRTRNRGWLLNFFGADDKFDNVKDMIEGLGYDLYDAYGNLNAEGLQAILNTYTDLSEADKDWIEKAIAYSDQYKEAMEGLASYLENIFGQVADTLADQLVESFLEGGDAAMDFGSVVSDVAKGMAKDFVKNMLLENVFNKYGEQFKAIMTDENMSMEDKQKAMLAYFTAMQADAEALQPVIQAYLQGMSQFFDEAEAGSIGTGTALSSASQESIDLLNGQLNAMRTVQGYINNTIGNILTQLMGLRGDVTGFRGDSNSRLDRIIDNTSESGLGRAFMGYFG